MTLRPALAGIALLATLAAGVASAEPNTETTTASNVTAVRQSQTARKNDRVRPGPLKPRVIEAPGAAVMMIPASFDATQTGPFSRF